jgi:hypothetical protein
VLCQNVSRNSSLKDVYVPIWNQGFSHFLTSALITRVGSETKHYELSLELDFKLLPSKTMFSKIRADLYFDEKKVKSVLFDILHCFGSTDEFQLKVALDLNGISSGTHSVKAEMYESHSSR